MGNIFGGGDDSAAQAQEALLDKQYNDQQKQIAQARADQDNTLDTYEHAATGPMFDAPNQEGETVNQDYNAAG